MEKLNKFFKITNPKLHISLLMVLMGLVFLGTRIHILDDGFYYQQFAETLATTGRIDLTIPGFHGTSIFAALIYFLTKSPYSQVIFENITAILTIPAIYLAVGAFYKDKWKGVLAAYIYSLMPLIFITGFRGWSWTSVTFMTYLTIWLVIKKSNWSAFWFGMGIINKPFMIALAPFFIWKRMYKQLMVSLIIPIGYVILQYVQNGSLIIGAHPGLTTGQLFSIKQVFLNTAFAFQNYLSVHNFTPFNETLVTDMIHFSPFITFFALLSLYHYRQHFAEKRALIALLSATAIGFAIPALFSYYDRYYFTLFDLMLIIFAVPAMMRFRVLWPIIVANFGFQFIYTYLFYQPRFWPDGSILPIAILPVAVFIISSVYAYHLFRRSREYYAN